MSPPLISPNTRSAFSIPNTPSPLFLRLTSTNPLYYLRQPSSSMSSGNDKGGSNGSDTVKSSASGSGAVFFWGAPPGPLYEWPYLDG